MSANKTKTRKATAKEDAKTEEAQGCPCMPSGELPSCCGPGMSEMMSRFMGQSQETEKTQA